MKYVENDDFVYNLDCATLFDDIPINVNNNVVVYITDLITPLGMILDFVHMHSCIPHIYNGSVTLYHVVLYLFGYGLYPHPIYGTGFVYTCDVVSISPLMARPTFFIVYICFPILYIYMTTYHRLYSNVLQGMYATDTDGQTSFPRPDTQYIHNTNTCGGYVPSSQGRDTACRTGTVRDHPTAIYDPIINNDVHRNNNLLPTILMQFPSGTIVLSVITDDRCSTILECPNPIPVELGISLAIKHCRLTFSDTCNLITPCPTMYTYLPKYCSCTRVTAFTPDMTPITDISCYAHTKPLRTLTPACSLLHEKLRADDLGDVHDTAKTCRWTTYTYCLHPHIASMIHGYAKLQSKGCNKTLERRIQLYCPHGDCQAYYNECEPHYTVPKVKIFEYNLVPYTSFNINTLDRNEVCLVHTVLVTEGTVWRGGRSSLLVYYCAHSSVTRGFVFVHISNNAKRQH